MTDSMVERVAQAVLNEMTGYCEPDDATPGWTEARVIARAAIAAMREPTEVMWNAFDDPKWGGRWHDSDSGMPNIQAWQIMIDAALDDQS